MERKPLRSMRFILGILTLVLSLAVASPARAILTLYVSDGTVPNTFTITDNLAGDLSPVLGSVVYTNSFGNVIVNVDTGISKPVIGSIQAPALHLDSILATNGPVTLTLRLSDTDFSGAGLATFLAGLGGVLSAPAGSSVSLSAYLDLANNLFGTSTLLCTTGPLTSTPSFSGNCGVNNVLIDNAYSVTVEAIVNLTGTGTASLNAIVKDVPEPSSMILLGAGLLGMVAWAGCKVYSN